MHLTNVAIQKKNEKYAQLNGTKWGLRELKLFMISEFGIDRVEELFAKIQEIIVRSCHAVQDVMINDKRCFEL